MTLWPPANANLGTYEVVIRAERASDYFTTYRLQVTIIAPTPDTGNGGCVLPGTEILTPAGEVEVEVLDLNDVVIGWDFSNNEPKEVLWAGIADTLEYYGLTINDGALVIPAWGQRIWARTALGTGWLDDAIDLQVGDLVFDVAEQKWVEVTSRVPTNPVAFVCDLRTNHENAFVARGILVGGWQP